MLNADHRTNAGRHSPAVLYLSVAVFGFVLGLVIWQNWKFVQDGMLRPDFGIVHAAYRFNLIHLVWILASACAGFFALGCAFRDSRRSAFLAAMAFALLALGVAGLRYYVTRVEPERINVHTVRLETGKLSAPLRILHISDIQAGAVGPYQERIFRVIAEIDPDLILNTGDYLQVVPPATFKEEFPKLVALFEKVDPDFGIFGVFGDTDYEGLHAVRPEKMAPLKLLSSRDVLIKTHGGSIAVLGLSLFQSKNAEWAERTVSRWLENSADGEFRILMGHAPDFALAAGDLPVDLCLAGHTHGGQVRLPFIGPLVIDSEVPKAWATGFRSIGTPHLNVSAGAGSNRFGGLPPLRFNCPTEMTLIELVPTGWGG